MYTRVLLLLPLLLCPCRANTPPTPADLSGKRLILCEREYNFPTGNEHSRLHGRIRHYHRYTPANSTFTVGTTHNSPHIRGGVGHTTWQLRFTTPTSGTATLISYGPRHRGPAKGTTCPFRIENSTASDK